MCKSTWRSAKNAGHARDRDILSRLVICLQSILATLDCVARLPSSINVISLFRKAVVRSKSLHQLPAHLMHRAFTRSETPNELQLPSSAPIATFRSHEHGQTRFASGMPVEIVDQTLTQHGHSCAFCFQYHCLKVLIVHAKQGRKRLWHWVWQFATS